MERSIRKAGWIAVSIVLGMAVSYSATAQGLTKVSDGVYSYVDAKHASPQSGFGANAGIVIGKDGVLVVDTLVSAKQARQFIKDIRTITNRPIRYVVNTHGHLDHAFGDSEFQKLGAIVVTHRDCKLDMARNGEAILKNAGAYGLAATEMEGTTIARPAISFTDRMEISLGDIDVELIDPGPSHSPGSILVAIPRDKVLFAGDALFTGYHPYLGDGNLEGWLKVLDRIGAMDADKIVPGHGPLSGKKDVADMKEYLLAFDRNAKELCAGSGDVESIVSGMKKVLPQRAESDFLIKANLEMRYLKKRGE